MIEILASLFLASTVATGQLSICDTQQQIERLSHLIGYQPRSAIRVVNTEEKKSNACAIVNVAYITGPVINTIREGEVVYNISEVLVIAIVAGDNVNPITPERFYGLIPVDERKA